MVSLSTVEEQLKKIGANFRFMNRAEVKELSHILLEGEVIAQCIGGQYEGGYALLAATNSRVLLVDKKPKYLTLKDIRYDMITELDFSRRMMNATVNIHTPNKTLKFTAYNQYRMRALFHHAQEKVMESRMHYMNQGQQMHVPGVPDIGVSDQPAAFAAFLAANAAIAAEPATASVVSPPRYVPNQARSANELANSYAEHIPLEPKMPPPTDEHSATAYANMPLIMSGWRRRVYGYHRPQSQTPPTY
jgi:hypothetical protein